MTNKKIIPLSLRKFHGIIRGNISQTLIIDIADEIVESEMTYDILIGSVASALLKRDEINALNDASFGFKKNLLMYVNEVIGNRYSSESKTTNYISKDGSILSRTSKHITNEKEATTFDKKWFREVSEPQTHLVLKGSGKIVDNNSKTYLESLAKENLRVKNVSHDLVRLYATLKYEENKNSVSESKSEYKARLEAVAEETILYMGYEFANTKKLDGSTRGHHLSRFGFANPFGDAFEKNLIEVPQEYIVTKAGVQETKDYLKSEFKVKSWRKLFEKANKAIEKNLRLLKVYNSGKNVEFTIDSKTLGKYMHITEAVNEIVYNLGGATSCLISVDFTASGPMMFASLFGDEKFMSAGNLRGGSKRDTHQETADVYGCSRDDAKTKNQPGNHGARIDEDLKPTIRQVFGERYFYINALAEYGKKMALAGVTSVCLVRPDGVKGYWAPYVKNCKVSMEDDMNTTIHAIMPFATGIDGEAKGYGFGVIWAHMTDAYIEAFVTSEMKKRFGIQIKTILDAYYIPAGCSNNIKLLVFEAFENMDGWFLSQLKSVELQTGIKPDMEFKGRELPIVKSNNIF